MRANASERIRSGCRCASKSDNQYYFGPKTSFTDIFEKFATSKKVVSHYFSGVFMSQEVGAPTLYC